MYPDSTLLTRLGRFAGWAHTTTWSEIPDSAEFIEIGKSVSKTPVWLTDPNPFENHPFAENPETALPERVEVAVIGAGLVGAATAYHWSQEGRESLIVLERLDPAAGSAGRNEGLAVMGRYYAMVYGTVLDYLRRSKPSGRPEELQERADGHARAYCRAAYENAELLRSTIEREGIQCDYTRKGWVQATDSDHLESLENSVRLARDSGFNDWKRISSREALQRSGIQTSYDAGFSVGSACWHPAKWVWGLFRAALSSPSVNLFCRTAVLQIRDDGPEYSILTSRGTVRARYVINATESHTPLLFSEFRDVILPTQTQAAFGPSEDGSIKAGVGISIPQGFFGLHRKGILFGSDATRVPDNQAGSNQPSRFITRYVASRLQPRFRIRRLQLTHEWSGTVSYTPDEFPLVGLMDGKRCYMVGGMAGSGSAVSFLGARHLVHDILGISSPCYYPQEYFSPSRFFGRSE